jgi:DNA-binding MarR family transcriptional regulator
MVRLLAATPRPVGEIALALDLRQPQVTKHLQTLERVGERVSRCASVAGPASARRLMRRSA